MFEQLDEPVRLTKRYGVMKTDDRTSYQIDIDSQSFDLLEIIIVQGDLDMIIRLFDRSKFNEMRKGGDENECTIINVQRTIEKVLLLSEEKKSESFHWHQLNLKQKEEQRE